MAPRELAHPVECTRRARADWPLGEEALHVVGHFRRRSVTPGRFLLQTLEADGFQVARQRGIEQPGWHRIRFEYQPQSFGRGRGIERSPPGHQMVEKRAQAVHITGHGDLRIAAGHLFSCGVTGRAEHLAGQRSTFRTAEHFGQAEVGDPRPVLFVNNHIGGLEVAVQDAALVRVVHRPGQQPQDLRGAAGRQRPAAANLRQVAAGHQIHRVVWLAVHLAVVVDRDDVRVLQAGGRGGFQLKPAQGNFACVGTRQQKFYCHGAAECRLPRRIDHPHAAPADLLHQLVGAKRPRKHRMPRRRGFIAHRFQHRAKHAGRTQRIGRACVQRGAATLARHNDHGAGRISLGTLKKSTAEVTR